MTDILEIIKKFQEMYGDDVITTADKINRPDPKPIVKEIEAINEFVRRNPKADGGQLVAPSVDGSRPGYAGRYEDTEYGSRVKYDTKLKKYVKRVTQTVDGKKKYNVYTKQKTNENIKQFLERAAEKGKFEISKAKIARDKINLGQRMYTNNWTKNWLDQNLSLIHI